uniref:hypothetical protein n=1 Tax=Lactobacillus jensenii TaxID=109790 RepID=UPI0028707FA3
IKLYIKLIVVAIILNIVLLLLLMQSQVLVLIQVHQAGFQVVHLVALVVEGVEAPFRAVY